MNTFIRVAEVWVPGEDGSLLELAGGIFDQAPAFGAITRKLCFGRAEGLPGHAWDEGHPLLLGQLQGSYFQRTAAARAAGLECAVALPIFLGGKLTSVVVLLCGEPAEHVGAIELWHNDPRVTTDLKLVDAYFGTTTQAVEEYSRDGSLSRGAGAPGLAWQREAAVFIENVADSPQFLRAQVAAPAGIVRALALPCSTPRNDTWVLSLLSSGDKPMARRVESWLPDEDGKLLRRSFGYCETQGRLSAEASASVPMDDAGVVGRAWHSAVAQTDTRSSSDGKGRPSADTLPFASALAIPVISDDAVSEVVVLHF